MSAQNMAVRAPRLALASVPIAAAKAMRSCSLVLWPLGRGLWRCVMAFTTSSRLFSCTLVTASCHWATDRWMPDWRDDPRSRSILPMRVTTLACSLRWSMMRRSTREGEGGSRGSGTVLAEDTLFPGKQRASSASVFFRSLSN